MWVGAQFGLIAVAWFTKQRSASVVYLRFIGNKGLTYADLSLCFKQESVFQTFLKASE
jgi:hypothetical protein